jgi:hypothetical protein
LIYITFALKYFCNNEKDNRHIFLDRHVTCFYACNGDFSLLRRETSFGRPDRYGESFLL